MKHSPCLLENSRYNGTKNTHVKEFQQFMRIENGCFISGFFFHQVKLFLHTSIAGFYSS